MKRRTSTRSTFDKDLAYVVEATLNSPEVKSGKSKTDRFREGDFWGIELGWVNAGRLCASNSALHAFGGTFPR
jgi:hypothetical protein